MSREIRHVLVDRDQQLELPLVFPVEEEQLALVRELDEVAPELLGRHLGRRQAEGGVREDGQSRLGVDVDPLPQRKFSTSISETVWPIMGTRSAFPTAA